MPAKTIVFVTGNAYKFQIAKSVLDGSAFKLVRRKLDVPEIQNESVEKIAAFSARWASDVLKKPVAVSDAGCYIEALKGFPGPFVKYINRWLSAEDLLQIMRDKKNRRVIWQDCLAYGEPGKKPVTFMSYFNGRLAVKAGVNIHRRNYGWMDTLFVPDGHTAPLSELPTEAYLKFWSQNENHDSWRKLSRYLKKNKKKFSD